MSDLILFWHRCDLRISDNRGLAAARERSSKLVGVFCLDPNILQRDDLAPARVAYLMGCLAALQQRYQAAGSQLLFLHGEPEKAIPQLATTLAARTVFWTRDVEPYSQQRDRVVREALESVGIEVCNGWDKLLHAPGEILTQAGNPYTVYGPFWKNWSCQEKLEPAPTPSNLQGLTAEEHTAAQKAGAIALPTAKDLGYSWDRGFLVEPGEEAARDRLAEFCDRALENYQEQRNLPAVEGTSFLSGPLKFGAIGIRTLWQATAAALANSRSDESRNSIIAWQKELAWREFYQHALYAFPDLANGPYRDRFKNFPWDNNEDYFQAWCDGKTGYPIVDAAMRQLNETGWMHNRCRMIVASFLTKDLIVNWQWGEKYFMQNLWDGDLASNNGGWQWSASSGMDPKPLRFFNPARQAQRYDPEGDYIRQWLPELSSLEPEYLVSGKIPPLECQQCGYPQPIVDRAKQQREFKERYKQQI